ncbi:MAG: arginine repressor [Planctomycetota bacterium]
MSARDDRHHLITEIVAERSVRSQGELQMLLAEHGTEVTQATLSRDLRELGLVKAPEGYRLPADGTTPDPLERAVQQFVTSVEPVGQLVIVRTGPGQAQLVAALLDDAPPTNAAGTIAGDDTIFIAARSTGAARVIAERLGAHAGIGKGGAA